VSSYKGAAPRFFEATNVERGNRPEHVMVAGGRDGPEIGNIPPKSAKYWSGGASARWTEDLQSQKTLPRARTQAPFLLEVRPQQREWGRGFMSVEEMLSVWGIAKTSKFYGEARPEVEITFYQPDEKGQLVFARIRARLMAAPVFVGTEDMPDAVRGAPISAESPTPKVFQHMLKAAVEGAKIGMETFVTRRDGTKLRLRGVAAAGKDALKGTDFRSKQELTVPREDIAFLSLFDPNNPALMSTSFLRSITGIQVQPLNITSGAKEGDTFALPFLFVARTRLIYPQPKDRPPRVASEFSGDTKRLTDLLEKASTFLERLKRDLIVEQAKRVRRKAEPEVVYGIPGTEYALKLTARQALVWTNRGDAVALLTGGASKTADIVVTPEDYLRIVRTLPPKTRKRRRKLDMNSNPRHPLRSNPIVYYRDQSELDALRQVMDKRLFKKLMDQNDIRHISEKPRRAAKAQVPGFVSAGRRAASTGAGLRITRRNSGDDEGVTYTETTHRIFKPGTPVALRHGTAAHEVLSHTFVGPIRVISTHIHTVPGLGSDEEAMIADDHGHMEIVGIRDIEPMWERRPARRTMDNPSHRTAAQIRAEIEALLEKIHEIDRNTNIGAFTQRENAEVQRLYRELRELEGPPTGQTMRRSARPEGRFKKKPFSM